MDLDDFIITVLCLIDEAIPIVLDSQRLRQRGPAPLLYESEVMTMEVVGSGGRLPGTGARPCALRLLSTPLRPLLSGPTTRTSHHLRPSSRQPLAPPRTAVAAAAWRSAS